MVVGIGAQLVGIHAAAEGVRQDFALSLVPALSMISILGLINRISRLFF
jgi:uncharacterized membrane protein YwaF